MAIQGHCVMFYCTAEWMVTSCLWDFSFFIGGWWGGLVCLYRMPLTPSRSIFWSSVVSAWTSSGTSTVNSGRCEWCGFLTALLCVSHLLLELLQHLRSLSMARPCSRLGRILNITCKSTCSFVSVRERRCWRAEFFCSSWCRTVSPCCPTHWSPRAKRRAKCQRKVPQRLHCPHPPVERLLMALWGLWGSSTLTSVTVRNWQLSQSTDSLDSRGACYNTVVSIEEIQRSNTVCGSCISVVDSPEGETSVEKALHKEAVKAVLNGAAVFFPDKHVRRDKLFYMMVSL